MSSLGAAPSRALADHQPLLLASLQKHHVATHPEDEEEPDLDVTDDMHRRVVVMGPAVGGQLGHLAAGQGHQDVGLEGRDAPGLGELRRGLGRVA